LELLFTDYFPDNNSVLDQSP